MYGLNPTTLTFDLGTTYFDNDKRHGEHWTETVMLDGDENPCDDQEATNREVNYIARKVGGRFVGETLTIRGLEDVKMKDVVQRFTAMGFQLFISFNTKHPGANLEWQWMNGEYGDTHFYHVTVEASKYITKTVSVPSGDWGAGRTSVDVKIPDPGAVPSRITIHCDSAENYSPHHIWYDFFRMTCHRRNDS